MNEVRRFSDGAGRRIPFNALSYFVAGLCALLYAWFVSLTEYRQTGLQFVTPLLVIFIVQSLWCVVTLGITPNLFSQITRRTLNTSFLLMFSVLLFSALVPQPAHGTGLEDIFSGVMGVIVCLSMILVVGLVIGAVLFYMLKGAKIVFRRFNPKANEDKDKKVNEIASIVIAGTLLLVASAEGIEGAYSFGSDSNSSATHLINANEEQVWQALGTATQPDFPLPSIITIFPQPVAVVIDEGVALNATRVVQFKGREGKGI